MPGQSKRGQRRQCDCHVGCKSAVATRLVEIALDQAGVDVALGESGMARQLEQEFGRSRPCRRRGQSEERLQASLLRAPSRSVAVHDDLGDHRVVERCDGVALAHAGVDAHAAVSGGKLSVLSVPVAGRKPRAAFSA